MSWDNAILPSAEVTLPIGWDDLTPEQQAQLLSEDSA